MGTKVIKGGTVVAAERTYEADVLIEGGAIKQLLSRTGGIDAGTDEARWNRTSLPKVLHYAHHPKPWLAWFGARDVRGVPLWWCPWVHDLAVMLG